MSDQDARRARARELYMRLWSDEGEDWDEEITVSMIAAALTVEAQSQTERIISLIETDARAVELGEVFADGPLAGASKHNAMMYAVKLIRAAHAPQTVTDDGGHVWTFDGERIKCEGDDTRDGGYYCDSLEDGRRLLIELGYITANAQSGD